MSVQPTFAQECSEAFNLMNTQESPNDFFVCGFDGETHVMKLVEQGKGGMARVKEILREQFADKTAVAMFRVTAVDNRENTTSFRTKLIHVIYIGPNTPVMKRAKITSFNAALKQPFSFNLAIQTTDENDDLTEKAIEKTLRASGGAHQPTGFDFTNSSAPGEGESKMLRKSDAARSPGQAGSPAASSPAPSSPSPSSPAPVKQKQAAAAVDIEQFVENHRQALRNLDVGAVVSAFSDASRLVLVNISTKETTVLVGVDDIKSYYETHLARFVDAEPTTFISGQAAGGNTYVMNWSNASIGLEFVTTTWCIDAKGKIIVQVETEVNVEASQTEHTIHDEHDHANEGLPVVPREQLELEEKIIAQMHPSHHNDAEAAHQQEEFVGEEDVQGSALQEMAEELSAEEPAVEDAPSEDVPAEDAPTEDAPADDVPVEDTPAEDVTAEGEPAEENAEENTEEQIQDASGEGEDGHQDEKQEEW